MSREGKNEKKRLDNESAAEYFEMGERFARRIKLDSAVRNINDFGQRRPIRFFVIIVLMLLGAFAINFHLYSGLDLICDDMGDINIDRLIPMKEHEIKVEITQELQSIYAETEHLVDTLSIVMAKENLTTEDSLFVMKKMARLEVLDRVLNEEYIEDDRED